MCNSCACVQVSLEPGELPVAFEGEERSLPGVGDLMQVRLVLSTLTY